MGEHMVYHGEGSTFAGKENECRSCLVFIDVHYSQGTWQCSTVLLCISLLFSPAILFFDVWGIKVFNDYYRFV